MKFISQPFETCGFFTTKIQKWKPPCTSCTVQVYNVRIPVQSCRFKGQFVPLVSLFGHHFVHSCPGCEIPAKTDSWPRRQRASPGKLEVKIHRLMKNFERGDFVITNKQYMLASSEGRIAKGMMLCQTHGSAVAPPSSPTAESFGVFAQIAAAPAEVFRKGFSLDIS